MLSARLFLSCLLAIGMLAACGPAATAIVVENMAGTTAPPTGAGNDPGWNNVTIGVVGSRNFIYLGNAWALSAAHVGPLPTDPNQALYFSSGTIDLVPNKNFVVQNPGGVANPGPNQLALNSDLRLVRLKAEPTGLSSIFGANPQFTIASQQLVANTPAAAEPVMFIGHGRTRADNLTNWDSSWVEVPPSIEPIAYTGYKATNPNDDTKRWGTNVIADENPLFNHSDTNLQVTFRQFPDTPSVRDTVTMVTQFNAPEDGGLLTEAQAVDKDSGSAVFQKRNGQWQLVGIINSIYTKFPDTNEAPPNQPNFTAVYDNLTVFADLSFYHSQIFNIIDSNPHYSIVGDVNMDGIVAGTGAGPATTDDVTAFIQGIDGTGTDYQGWGYNNGTGAATITSWKNGDISHPFGVGACVVPIGDGLCAGGDGKTDVYDFLALRKAIDNPMASAALASHLGISASVVPEPSAATLMIVAAAFLLALGRRQTGRACWYS